MNVFETNRIMTAKEALQKTKEVHLNAIMDFIQKAIDKGEVKCEILPTQQFVSEENIKILKENGFEVSELKTMTGDRITINWEDA